MFGDSPWKAMKMSCATSSRAVIFLIHLRTVEEALIGGSLGGNLRTAGWTASAATRRRPVIRDKTTVSVYRFRVGHRLWKLLMDQELRRLRSYEQDAVGENTTDAGAGCNHGPLLRSGLEPKSPLKPAVASACPFPRSVASVHVGRNVGDRHLAPLAQIERAEGRAS